MAAHSTPDRAAVKAVIEAVEAEMRRIGVWDATQPADEQLAEAGAFGAPTMSFTQWLRWVFVPRVHELLESGAALPDHSAVATHATREWGFSPLPVDTAPLEDALRRFDDLFESSESARGRPKRPPSPTSSRGRARSRPDP
jgi:uncharacterized protein YqcC (DUF446 family)